MRELFWTAESRRQEDWQHTAWLAAMIANANRDPKRKPSPFTPDDFNPMVGKDKRDKAIDLKDMAVLKDAFRGQHTCAGVSCD